MNYYEELGLTPSASSEEIRQAYKNLARLLHPDPQQEERLRQVAECQMKRLNALCGILTDPAQRAAYDRSLHRNGAAAVRERYGVHQVWIWLAATIMATVGLLSYFGDQPGQARPARPRRTAEPLAPPASPKTTASRRREPRERRAEGRRRTARQRAARAAAILPEPPALAAQLRPLVALRLPQPQLPAESARPRPRSIAGTWFYNPPRVAPVSPSLYPPEFIEAVIVAESGLLCGRYRARYKVPDRAISPEVQFQFEGRQEREPAEFPWVGSGGARGEVRLRLVSDDALEVSWSAEELGASLGLASGTAVLTRRQEP